MDGLDLGGLLRPELAPLEPGQPVQVLDHAPAGVGRLHFRNALSRHRSFFEGF
jgi:hypothetical protein